MRKITRIVIATGLVLAATACLADGAKDVIMPAASIQWEDGPEGTKVAKLWGDMTKGGPFGVLVKFNPGVTHALHKHTHDLKIVVLAGSYWHTPEGGTQALLGPGSYLLAVGGQNHTSGCTAEAACEFLMTGDDKFDLIPAGHK